MKPTVSVVIVNWNSGDLLKECLSRIVNQTYPPTHIFVVDNGSTDGSVNHVNLFERVTLLPLKTNTGFAAANNRAIELCVTDYIALINPDAFADLNWLKQLVLAAIDNPTIAAFGSQQLIFGQPNVLDGTGDIYHISGLVWRDGYGRLQNEFDTLPKEIFSPCAGAALYVREAIQNIGNFDEDFFCYVEDVDLGFRLRIAGYQSIYVPSAIVHHVGSATTGGHRSLFSVYHGHRNLVWAYVKNMPTFLFWTLLPLHIILNIASIFYFSITGNSKIILKAKYDAIKGLPKMLKKRRSVQKIRKVSIKEIWNILDKRLIPNRK